MTVPKIYRRFLTQEEQNLLNLIDAIRCDLCCFQDKQKGECSSFDRYTRYPPDTYYKRIIKE